MASCLHPRWIRVDRRDKNPLRFNDSKYTRYKDVRPSMHDFVPCPCGKCINCLKNKQNAMVSRCLEESNKRGTFSFVTLTYREDTLPIAQSLWRASIESGEVELVHDGEIVSSSEDTSFRFEDRQKLLDIVRCDKPRYFDKTIEGFNDGEYEYFSRLTPSLNRRDFRLWIKRCRVSYEREFGNKLDFSYVCVGEMGPRTCRPHYHLALFGLTREQVRYFTDRWSLGYTCVRHVNSINPDGTDGFAIASRYIGKYMSKGKFDCESVLNKSAIKPRVCQSKGIGRSLIDKLRSNMCCFDMYGQYDLDTFFCPSLGRCLNDNEVSRIVDELPKRLVYDSSYGFKLPIPRLFRDDVFYHKTLTYDKVRRIKTVGNRCESCECKRTKVVRVPTALWALVSASLREHFFSDLEQKFRAYLAKFSAGEIALACSRFEEYSENIVQISEHSRETNYKNFLTQSKDGQ